MSYKDEVLHRTGLFEVLYTVRKRRLGLFGHVARLRSNVPANLILRICTKTRDGERPSQSGDGLRRVETQLQPTIYYLGPPELPWHGCNSDRGPAASGGQTVLANDRKGGRLRPIASRHDDELHSVLYKPHLQCHSGNNGNFSYTAGTPALLLVKVTVFGTSSLPPPAICCWQHRMMWLDWSEKSVCILFLLTVLFFWLISVTNHVTYHAHAATRVFLHWTFMLSMWM